MFSSFSKNSKKSKNISNASSPSSSERTLRQSDLKNWKPPNQNSPLGLPEQASSSMDSEMAHPKASSDRFDDLPSFEMHNSLLNRTFEATDSPDYENAESSFSDNQTGTLGNVPVRPSLVSQGTANSLTRFQHSNQDSILNNLNSLTKVRAPLSITIELADEYRDGRKRNATDPVLREFTTGDTVAGIVTVRNTSSKPIKFDMFTVSLEGYAKVLTGSSSSNLKYFTHTFLNMFDLNASFYTCKLAEPYTLKIDPSDGCYIGLPVDKIFQPSMTYKKSFTFKFPSVLLDHVCTHQHDAHFMLPPTFGLDRSSMDGRAEKVAINSSTGYGVLSELGSPILTRDLSYANESISYVIKARALSRKEDHDIKDGEFNRIILAEREYHLRFIPVNAYDNPVNYELSTDVQFRMLKKSIDSNICKLEQHYQLLYFGIEPDGVDYNLSRLYFNEKDSEKKLDLYHYKNDISLKYDVDKLEGSERKKLPDARLQSKKVYEEEAFELRKQSMMSIPMSNKRSQNGSIRMRAKIPSTGLTYIRPNFCNPMMEQREKVGLNLQVIEVELEYVPPMNCHTMNVSKIIKPPQEDIEIKDILLETVTYRSIEPVPVTFASSSFVKEEELAEHKKDFLTFQKRLDKLPKKFVHANMPKQTVRDIKAMVDLRYHNNNVKVLKIKSQVQEKWHPVEILDEDNPSPKSSPSSPLYDKSSSGYFPPAEAYFKSGANNSSTQSSDKHRSKIKWAKKIVIEIDFNYQQDFKHLILVPTFSTCLLGRLYGIVINVDFHSYGVKSLNVPIKVYNMGWNAYDDIK